MFRRKEESFDFESEEGEGHMQHASNNPGGEPASASQEASRPAAPSVAAAPRPASLAQAPGAAPRSPATAPAPSTYRPAAPSAPSAPASAPVASAPMPAPSAARPAAPSSPSAPTPGGFSSAASGSATNNSKTGGKRILTVGNDILLKGEIATCDRLVIEGEVDAKLNDVHTVEIAETGSFRGKAEIEDAEISGVFEGDLVVRNRLTIYSTGKVRGNITFGEIEIERGGELTGTISIVGQASGKSKEKAA